MDIALQIDGKWAVLPDDTEISVEENSPIFGEGNTYSFPFELNIEENRHIIGNSDQISGESLYKVLDKKDAVLYAGGSPFFYGIISLEDEIEVNDGHIEISLVSSTLTLEAMVEDMESRDVPLKDKIGLGSVWDEVYYYWRDANERINEMSKTRIYLPKGFMEPFIHISAGNKYSTVNVSDPYPVKPYCNIRIAYPAPEMTEDDSDGYFISSISKGPLFVLDAERNQSAPCFYVMYFLECLFAHLGVIFNYDEIEEDSDLFRLAFINTKCAYEVDTSGVMSLNSVFEFDKHTKFVMSSNQGFFMPEMEILARWKYNTYAHDNYLTRKLFNCWATSENFPDSSVSDVLDVLKNMLKVAFLYDNRTKSVNMVFLKNVLKENQIKTFNCEILAFHKKENPINGYRLTYEGDEDDTSYNYKDWDNPEIIQSYNKMLSGLSATNKTLYIDKRNGNAYRVKIDKNADSIETANESWFEVGQYVPVEYGDCSNEDRTEECVLKFTPLTVNDTTGNTKIETLKSKLGVEDIDDVKDNDQEFALFLDVEMEYPYPKYMQLVYDELYDFLRADGTDYQETKVYVGYKDPQRYTFNISQRTLRVYGDISGNFQSVVDTKNYPTEDPGSPIQKADLGLTLGIMRGPGNQSGREDYEKDYDDEGNEKYRIVPKNYAMHSDSVDNYARVFDYNGTGEGGVDVTNRFSLKLKAEKPVATGSKEYRQCSLPECAERGLFDKFHKEYAHFVTNRKIAILELRMELADLINIDWKSRYTIGGITGFVNKYSCSISNRGISTVTMELYYL